MRLGAELDSRVQELLVGLDAKLQPQLKAFATEINNIAYREGYADGREDGVEAGYQACQDEREEE